jgi:hypothetical protein
MLCLAPFAAAGAWPKRLAADFIYARHLLGRKTEGKRQDLYCKRA